MWSFGVLLFWGCCVMCNWEMAKPQLKTGDVNECADTTTCPAYATCTNTLGSYYCTCKRGFLSSNGQSQFRDPGVQCKDVDECSESPPPCGPNSVCKNLRGRYQCSCLPGFSSPTGDWGPGKPGTFSCSDVDECFQDPSACGPNSFCTNTPGSYSCSCTAGFHSEASQTHGNFNCKDVNECADSTVCPAYATCTNTLGSYYCTCKRGFLSSNGQSQFRDPGVQCKDVDECSESPPPCGPNSVCKNLRGRYQCSCLPGFSSPTGDWSPGKPGTFSCSDVDECFQDPSACGPNSFCTNTPGSYSCSCTAGFRPLPEASQTHGNFSCKRIPFKCKEDVIPHNERLQQCHAGAAGELEYVPFCAMMNATFQVLDKVCENKTAAVSLQRTAESFTSVLEQKSTWTKFSREETSALATVLLESVESTTLAALLKPSENVSQTVQTVQTEHLDIESKVITEECHMENVSFNLKAKGDEMKIRCSVIEESESTGSAGVAFISFANMESVLDERFFQDPQSPWIHSKQRLKMNSRIVGGIMTGKKKDNLSDPVIYILENLQPKHKSERPICVSWSTDVGNGGWTPSGCEVLEASEMHTVCSCNQLANLAIIMASGELTMEFSLYIISHVGLSISLVCLALAIATFLLCHTIRSRNTFLHLHLCVCLFLAKILFLTGIDKTDNQVGCAIIAGCLHYLFLACFSWMLVEAVMLFLMVRNLKVVNYFSSRSVNMLHLCAFGYGLPGLVVAVSASVYPRGYGMHNRCWLSMEAAFIWSFLGPVCVIIMINSVLLTWTLCILRQKLSSVNAEVSTLKDTRLLTFKAFAQFFILGCSWVLGIFQFGPVASIMAYLFTIINSLQGAFIFFIHCLLSRQVREEYRRWLTGRTKPGSQSQTSGILLSSMPSVSRMG
ncbi:adhesion G protein-coupled receptor E1 [Sciurus carolinensis]|uniref:adhesion G protein-coupled receptor E1 n=1 Tax=Sciurus carolinensis TaxID=30640 RepID=UPI001FB3C08B|nr:adhesion G protein-coupled receptor E1 [Sciurus carolinensis]